MALNNEKLKGLRCQYKSYKNITKLIIDIIKINNINKIKIIKIVSIFILSFLFSGYCISINKFHPIFEIMIDIDISISVSLLGLLIAGFSIVLSSLNKDSLYLLILTKDKKNKDDSFFKRTLLLCIEPLIWFIILLVIAFSFKILYVLYPKEHLTILVNNIVKCMVLLIISIGTIFSLISLKTFILNMCNLLLMYANFEILERQAKSKGSNIEEIISQIEKD